MLFHSRCISHFQWISQYIFVDGIITTLCSPPGWIWFAWLNFTCWLHYTPCYSFFLFLVFLVQFVINSTAAISCTKFSLFSVIHLWPKLKWIMSRWKTWREKHSQSSFLHLYFLTFYSVSVKPTDLNPKGNLIFTQARRTHTYIRERMYTEQVSGTESSCDTACAFLKRFSTCVLQNLVPHRLDNRTS